MKNINRILACSLLACGMAVTSCDDEEVKKASALGFGGTEEVTAAEDSRAVTLGVTLDAPAASDIEIPFTLGGTATSGDDYTAPESSVSIAAGESSGNLTINIHKDCVAEGEETIVVTIGSVAGLTLGTSSVTVKIAENSDYHQSFFMGHYLSDEPGYGEYPVYFEKSTTNAHAVINSNFWDSGWHVTYVFNPETGEVMITPNSVNFGGATGTLRVASDGPGSYDPCTRSFVVPYIVTRPSDGVTFDRNVHTFTADE